MAPCVFICLIYCCCLLSVIVKLLLIDGLLCDLHLCAKFISYVAYVRLNNADKSVAARGG